MTARTHRFLTDLGKAIWARLGLPLLLSLCAGELHAREIPRVEGDVLEIIGRVATTWTSGSDNVVQVAGPVRIDLGDSTLTADHAVVWITRDAVPGRLLLGRVVLLGSATLSGEAGEQSADEMLVELSVGQTVRIVAEQRLASDNSRSVEYARALAVRAGQAAVQAPLPADQPTPARARQPLDAVPLRQRFDFSFGNLQTILTEQGTTAAILTGDVMLIERRSNGDLIELRAARAVLFTSLSNLADLQTDPQRDLADAVMAAYLEGDVRVSFTPADPTRAEQRMFARQVYYDFQTDQAVLTDAVLRSVEPARQIPIAVRAQTLRQLAQGEYDADSASLSTSSFATPGYSVAASRIRIKQQPTGDPRLGTRIEFDARHVTPKIYGLPFFYLPLAAGAVTERGLPLRRISFENSRTFGTGVRTEWGLLELLGVPPAGDLDLTLKLDYLSNRGPAVGVDARYGGNILEPVSRQSTSFQGNIRSYLVLDDGFDRLGRDRAAIPHDNDLRGRVLWEHQHFLPGDWQLQARSAWVSDPTFLEQWYRREFDTGLPADTSLYAKRQRDEEALTLLVRFQPNDIATTAGELQQFTPLVDTTLGVTTQNPVLVEYLPQVGYHLTGTALADDRLTFFSDNLLGGLRFNITRAELSDYGFRNRRFLRDGNGNFVIDPNTGQRVLVPAVLPGFPEFGYTGVSEDYIARGDLRQQLDWPIVAGPVKVVPYVMARYTAYSDSPSGGFEHRLLGGVGVRASTSFFRVYDDVSSTLLDLHRLRHIIEPEVHLFTSAATADRSDLFIYEPGVDGINDLSAFSFGVRQRFQTRRGAPDRRRSVDFLTINLRATFFAKKPEEVEILDEDFNLYTASAARGVFLSGMPEASIARDHLAFDSTWRVSDTTAVLTDFNYSFDAAALSTAAVGLAVDRGERLSYYGGVRYIGEVNATLVNFAINYDITAKYSVAFQQSYDLSSRSSASTDVTLLRRLDRLLLSFSVYYDQLNDEGGFRLSIIPTDLGFALQTGGDSSVSFGR